MQINFLCFIKANIVALNLFIIVFLNIIYQIRWLSREINLGDTNTLMMGAYFVDIKKYNKFGFNFPMQQRIYNRAYNNSEMITVET